VHVIDTSEFSQYSCENFILIDNNFSDYCCLTIYPKNNKDILFAYVGSSDNNKSAYVGIYDGKNVSKKLVKQVENGWINIYYDRIFTNSNDTNMQYIFFTQENWKDPSQNQIIIVTNDANENWYFKLLLNSKLINLNYDYKWDKNHEISFLLNSFTTLTLNPLKTSIYNNELSKITELPGVWNSITKFNDTYMYVSSYYTYERRGKYLITVDKNGNIISKNKFDHFVTEIASIDDNELYAFAHDAIGDNLYIYQSTDDGKTWDLFKTIKNFNYQIDYIIRLEKQSDGNIYCKMRVNDYSLSIESNDTFENWSISKTNYRVNNSNNKQNRYIEKIEKDGSITILGLKGE